MGTRERAHFRDKTPPPFLSLDRILKFPDMGMNYQGRRSRSLSGKVFMIGPTNVASHESASRMLIGLRPFHVRDVFPPRPRPRRQCASGAPHSIMSLARLAALSRMKLTSAIQLSFVTAAGVRIDPTPPGQILFSFDMLRTLPSRRELLCELVSTGWKRLPHKESDGNADTNRSVYSCRHTSCIFLILNIKKLI